MYQGDQYWLGFTITRNGSAVTPESIPAPSGVMLNFNDDEIVKEWPDHTEDQIKFQDSKWHVFIKDDESLSLQGKFKVQIRLKYEQGDNLPPQIYTSKPIETTMNRSIFTEEWDV